MTTICTAGILLVLQPLLPIVLPATIPTDKIRLQCTPRTFRVVPGEPMRLELTVRADSAAPVVFHVPSDSRLKLRALEKLPVRRSREGDIVHQRVVVWQGLLPGTVRMKTLSVQTRGRKLLLPEVTITIRDPAP